MLVAIDFFGNYLPLAEVQGLKVFLECRVIVA